MIQRIVRKALWSLFFFAFFEKFFVLILTSGGPASFIMPLQIGKTPIVVPRQHQYNEHVNDHQVEFARNVAQRMGTIIPVCAFIFVLLTSIIEKAGTFNAPMDMAQFSWIVIYWILTLVDVVTFCVLLIKLVTLLGSISFERLDICDVMENNIIELKPKATVKYIGANYMRCIDSNHSILEKKYDGFNTCVRLLVVNVVLSLILSFVCAFISMN